MVARMYAEAGRFYEALQAARDIENAEDKANALITIAATSESSGLKFSGRVREIVHKILRDAEPR